MVDPNGVKPRILIGDDEKEIFPSSSAVGVAPCLESPMEVHQLGRPLIIVHFTMNDI